ncbi:hypothetical protein AG1IA_06029 [Rhizoctonia solani AG-1 IA]|uniref:Uncharacterized protein n=1 Tax=Thanatephorus cucumeris (strain AG1-IA) TaxID=983506 RepID=L8WP61_THACA|nr:hypothetical protein AG1IA_06029 [Rhizoctonia solani AG-1 IA]
MAKSRNTKLAVLLTPTAFLYLIFKTIDMLPWYSGIPLAMAEFFGMHHIISRVLLNHQSYSEPLTGSPYFAGIILGSLVWVTWGWATILVHGTSRSPHLNQVILKRTRAGEMKAASCPLTPVDFR